MSNFCVDKITETAYKSVVSFLVQELNIYLVGYIVWFVSV